MVSASPPAQLVDRSRWITNWKVKQEVKRGVKRESSESQATVKRVSSEVYTYIKMKTLGFMVSASPPAPLVDRSQLDHELEGQARGQARCQANVK